MAVEAATVPWTAAEDKLAEALPNLTAWQLLTKTDGAVAAAEFVFVDEATNPVNGEAYSYEERKAWPCYGICYSDTNESYRLTPIGVPGDGLNASGTLVLFVERLISELEDNQEPTAELAREASDRWFKNRIGELLEQLYVWWYGNGGPRLIEALVLDGPHHTHPDERKNVGHWQGVEIQIRWGLRER